MLLLNGDWKGWIRTRLLEEDAVAGWRLEVDLDVVVDVSVIVDVVVAGWRLEGDRDVIAGRG